MKLTAATVAASAPRRVDSPASRPEIPGWPLGTTDVLRPDLNKPSIGAVGAARVSFTVNFGAQRLVEVLAGEAMPGAYGSMEAALEGARQLSSTIEGVLGVIAMPHAYRLHRLVMHDVHSNGGPADWSKTGVTLLRSRMESTFPGLPRLLEEIVPGVALEGAAEGGRLIELGSPPTR